MKVTLLNMSDNINICQQAVRSCKTKKTLDELAQESIGYQSEILAKALDAGHMSVLEHIHFSFGIEDVSRALTHQLVRHRLMSYSQKSQRYSKLDKDSVFSYFVTPPSITVDTPEYTEYIMAMEFAFEQYHKLIEAGVPAEDARYVLPNATKSALIMSGNGRAWVELLQKRLCNDAQWEIRDLAKKILEILQHQAPWFMQHHAFPYCDVCMKCSGVKT